MLTLSTNIGAMVTMARAPTAAPLARPDLIYNTSTGDFEISNAIDFPGATWVWERMQDGIIAGEATTVVPGPAANGDFVRVYPSGNTAAASHWVVALPSRDVLDVSFSDAPDNTPLNGWNGFIAPAGIYLSGGKIYAASKITGSSRLIVNGDATIGVSAERISQSVMFTIDNNGEDDGYGFMSSRSVKLQYSASDSFLEFSCRGTAAGLTKRSPAGWEEYGGVLNQWDGATHLPNGTNFIVQSVWVGTDLYLRSLMQKPGTAWRKWHPLDVGLGIPINDSPGTVVPGNAIVLSCVSSDYNGSEYPLPMFQGGLKIEAWSESPVTISEATPARPTYNSDAYYAVTASAPAETDIELGVIDSLGRLISPIAQATANSSGEITDAEVSFPTSTYGVSGGFLIARDQGHVTDSTLFSLIQVPNYMPIQPDMEIGVNVGPFSSGTTVMFSNLADQIRFIYCFAGGSQVNPHSTPHHPKTDVNGKLLPYIDDAAWAYGAREIGIVMREGSVKMPYGTSGDWALTTDAAPGDFTFAAGFNDGASLHNFVFNATGYTFKVTQEATGGGSETAWMRMIPQKNGGKGIVTTTAMDIQIRQAGRPTDSMFREELFDLYPNEPLIRGMQLQMVNAGNSVDSMQPNYPYRGGRYCQIDEFLDLCLSLNPAIKSPWFCQQIFPVAAGGLRKMAEKWAEDLRRIAAHSYTGKIMAAIGNEPWNWANPYLDWNWPLIDMGLALNIWPNESDTGTVRLVMCMWVAKVLGAYFKTGIFPSMDDTPFDDLSDLNQPELALGDRAEIVFEFQGNAMGLTSAATLGDWADAVGGIDGFIDAFSVSHYWYTHSDGIWDAPIRTGTDYAGAFAGWLTKAESQVSWWETNLPAWADTIHQRWPQMRLYSYEGRWHADEAKPTSDPANNAWMGRVRQLYLNHCRPSPEYKQFEKRMLRAMWNAGFSGSACYTMFELQPSGISIINGGEQNYFQWFGITDSSGAIANPATEDAQQAAYARLEMQALVRDGLE